MPAPEEYTVEAVVSREEWEGKEGTMVTYELQLAGESMVRKAHVPLDKDPAPIEGAQVSGWRNTGAKFGFATGGGGGGGGGGRSGGNGKSYDRSPDHPLVMQQRLHTSALSSAFAAVEQMLTFNLSDVKQPTDAAGYFKLLERTAEALKKTYPDQVLARAEAPPEVPAPSSAPAPVSQPQPELAAAPATGNSVGDDDDIPF